MYVSYYPSNIKTNDHILKHIWAPRALSNLYLSLAFVHTVPLCLESSAPLPSSSSNGWILRYLCPNLNVLSPVKHSLTLFSVISHVFTWVPRVLDLHTLHYRCVHTALRSSLCALLSPHPSSGLLGAGTNLCLLSFWIQCPP